MKRLWAMILLTVLLAFNPSPSAFAQELQFDAPRLPAGDTAKRVSPDKLKKITAAEAARIDESMQRYEASDDTLVINHGDSFYYYEMLDPVAMEIYDVMLMVAKDPVSEGNYGVMMTDLDPESDEYFYEMLCAYFALTYDHPELFWLYSASESTISFYSEAMSMNGLYLVYYGLTEPFTEYAAQMTAFNRAAQDFLSAIDTRVSDYEIVRQIHDRLIDLVTYDNYVLDHFDQEGQNLAHTAYGALVANSQGQSHFAVCDGYSLAFEYLLQQCGIECVVVAGNAGSTEADAAGHAWNLVRLDGEWYEVDATWDDAGNIEKDLSPDIDGYALYIEALNDAEYRDRIQHSLFLRSTDLFRDFKPGDNYRYTTRNGMNYVQIIGPSVHVRFADDGTLDPFNADPAVVSLAPVAWTNYE